MNSLAQPEYPLAGGLADAKYLEAVTQVLGISPQPPAEVETVLQTVIKPENISWAGASTWETAYVAGLRPIAIARAAQRAKWKDGAADGGAPSDVPTPMNAGDAKVFNEKWVAKNLSNEGLPSLVEKVAKYAYRPGADYGKKQLAGEALRRHVSRAARNVALANRVTIPRMRPSDAWADREGPRANFHNHFRKVLHWFLQSPPRELEPTKASRRPVQPNAVALVAHTGGGKTMMGGDLLAEAGVGEVEPDGHRRRALWVTTSQALARDLLNPEQTLRKCLGKDVRVSCIFEGNKQASNADADVVGVTIQSLEDALEDTPEELSGRSLINPDDFDLLIFDEAHHSQTSRLKNLLQRFDCPKVLMTATPTRSEYRSLLHDYHYTRLFGRREAIENGLASPARLVTLPAESDAHAEHLAAVAAVECFIRQGEKVVIYCQPGKDNGESSAQAIRISALINQYCEKMLDPSGYDPALTYAQMIGGTVQDNAARRQQFEDQEHGGAMTTCQMLGEGWNYENLKGTIHVGPQGDLVKFEQETGRPLRLKPDGGEAVLIEVTTPFSGQGGPPRHCLAQLFGLERVPGHDVVIGPKLGGAGEALNDPKSTPLPTMLEFVLPPELAALALPAGTLITEIIIEPEDRHKYEPPPGFSVTDEDLAEQHQVPRGYIQYHLEARPDEPAVPYKLLRRLPLVGQDEENPLSLYVRHYNEELLAQRLAKHPIPRVTEAIYSKSMMSRMLGCGEYLIGATIAELGLPPREPSRAPIESGIRNSRPVPRYTLEELSRIAEIIETLPVVEDGDLTYWDLLRQYPSAARELALDQRERKRYPPNGDKAGVDLFVGAATVAEVAAEQERRIKTLVPLSRVAAELGMTTVTLNYNLTDEERRVAAKNKFTPLAGGTQHAPHVPKRMAREIRRRLRPRGLEPTEIPYVIAKARAGCTEPTLKNALNSRFGAREPRKLPGSSYRWSILPIEALEFVSQRYPKAGIVDVDYGRLNRELEQGEFGYAREVQLLLGVKPEQLSSHEPDEADEEEPESEAQQDDEHQQEALLKSSAASAVVALATTDEKPTSVSESPEPEPRPESALVAAPETAAVEQVPEALALLPPAANPPSARPAEPAVVPPQQPKVQPTSEERTFTDADEVCRQLSCSPQALEFLVVMAKLPPASVLREGAEILGIDKSEAHKFTGLKLRTPNTGWYRLSSLATITNKTIEEVSEYALAAFRNNGTLGVNVCRTQDGLNVYISSNVYNSGRRHFSKRR